MRNPLSSDTVVIGVGNTILSDDGLGVHAARLLQNDPRVPSGVTILDGGTLGLELIPYALDASRVLFLDAVNCDKPPGSLTRMTGKGLLAASGGWSVHQVGITDLISGLFLVAATPQEIVVLGLQPANTDWGTNLSADVQAKLETLVEAAVTQLKLWSEARCKCVDEQAALPIRPAAEQSVSQVRTERRS